MAERRTLVSHPDYFHSLLRLKRQGVDTASLVDAIFEALEETENPLADARPIEKRSERWALEILGYTITIEPLEDGSKIKLLSIDL